METLDLDKIAIILNFIKDQKINSFAELVDYSVNELDDKDPDTIYWLKYLLKYHEFFEAYLRSWYGKFTKVYKSRSLENFKA